MCFSSSSLAKAKKLLIHLMCKVNKVGLSGDAACRATGNISGNKILKKMALSRRKMFMGQL